MFFIIIMTWSIAAAYYSNPDERVSSKIAANITCGILLLFIVAIITIEYGQDISLKGPWQMQKESYGLSLCNSVDFVQVKDFETVNKISNIQDLSKIKVTKNKEFGDGYIYEVTVNN